MGILIVALLLLAGWAGIFWVWLKPPPKGLHRPAEVVFGRRKTDHPKAIGEEISQSELAGQVQRGERFLPASSDDWPEDSHFDCPSNHDPNGDDRA